MPHARFWQKEIRKNDKWPEMNRMEETGAMELSVVVLCYQSGELIRKFVRQLKDEISPLNITFELVLVANYDTGTVDETPAIAMELAQEMSECMVIAKSKEGKMGWDMKSGIMATKGNFIAVIDGDGQMPASDIRAVYEIISLGAFDLVKTFRATRYDGVYRTVLSYCYNIFFRMLFHPDFPARDINSKPKIITREAISKMSLKSDDWFTDAEIMLEANRLKFRICEIATVFYKNERRPSFVKPGVILEFIYNLLHYRIKHR